MTRYAIIAPTIRIASKPSLSIIEKQAMKVAVAALVLPPDCSASTSSTTCLIAASSALPAVPLVVFDAAVGFLPSRMAASFLIIDLSLSTSLLNSSVEPPFLVTALQAANCNSISDFLAPEILPMVILSKPVVS